MASINNVLIPIEGDSNCPISEDLIVVYADPSTDRIFLHNLVGRPRKPFPLSYKTVVAWVNDKMVVVAELQIHEFMHLSDSVLPEKSKAKRDNWWTIIKPIIEDLEQFLVGLYGDGLISEIAKNNSKTRQQIYDAVYRYLRNGQIKNGLLPNYLKTGKGSRSPAKSKIGAPRHNSDYVGKNIDDDDVVYMRKILKKDYFVEGGKNLTDVYDDLLRHYYSEKITVNSFGDKEYIFVHPNMYPSINQLRYWKKKIAKSDGINEDEVRSRGTKYKKDKAGRPGNFIRPDGNGFWQVDSSKLDYELVSQTNRAKRIGTATIYWVTEMANEALVGLHVCLGNASYEQLRMALFNAMRTKVQFAKEHGVLISEDEWPMQNRPQVIFADNQELVSQISMAVEYDSNIRVVFVPPYRGDLKRDVENASADYTPIPKSEIDKQNVSENLAPDLASEQQAEANRYKGYVESMFGIKSDDVKEERQENPELGIEGVDEVETAHKKALRAILGGNSNESD